MTNFVKLKLLQRYRPNENISNLRIDSRACVRPSQLYAYSRYTGLETETFDFL